MLKVLSSTVILVLFLASNSFAQGGLLCADANGNGIVDVSDLVYMIEAHLGGLPPVNGHWDIDSRQGHTMGDIRYLTNYLFNGGPAPECPPFNPYPLLSTDDTIFLPSTIIPAGTGQTILPIMIWNQNRVSDLLLPLKISGLGSTIFLDSIMVYTNAENAHRAYVDESDVCIAISAISNYIPPGMNMLASMYFHYTSTPGGTIEVDTTSLPQQTYLNYVYGDFLNINNPPAIGIPIIVHQSSAGYPNMEIIPDTLTFYTLVGYPNPDQQSFTVISDGDPFSWYLSLSSSPLIVNPQSGLSGQEVQVTFDMGGFFSPGTYTYDIWVYSMQAAGSPHRVMVKLILRSQDVNFDTNCDGHFDISDIDYIIKYIFKPRIYFNCNPCWGG